MEHCVNYIGEVDGTFSNQYWVIEIFVYSISAKVIEHSVIYLAM